VYDWRLNGDALRLSDRLLGITTGPRKGFECPVPDAVKTAAPPTVAPPANKPQKRR
jgi:soluble lytic murein transglycosylase